jgi:hypothetical protein
LSSVSSSSRQSPSESRSSRGESRCESRGVALNPRTFPPPASPRSFNGYFAISDVSTVLVSRTAVIRRGSSRPESRAAEEVEAKRSGGGGHRASSSSASPCHATAPCHATPRLSGLSSAQTGGIFLLGFLLGGVISDYKEAEKLPGEIVGCVAGGFQPPLCPPAVTR